MGLTSVVLLCFTGIPALWYGVKSLIQMRFSRSQKSDKKAAIAGVALGFLFGVLGTGIAMVVGGSILLFSIFVEETEDPKRIGEILTTIGTIDVPESFEFDEAELLKGQFRRVAWKDYSGGEINDGRIRLVRATPNTQIGDPQVYGPSIRLKLDGDIRIESGTGDRESLSWTFAGKSRSITKIVKSVEDENFNVVRYVGTTRADKEAQAFALAVVVRDDGEYSEEDVRKIFESFKPADYESADYE